MQGRIRAGWYREPHDPPDYVLKVSRIAGAWIGTQHSRAQRRPCAVGGVIDRRAWQRLEPAEPIEGIPLDAADDL